MHDCMKYFTLCMEYITIQKKELDNLSLTNKGSIQNRIAIFRAERKWSQQAVADKVGVSRQTILSLENNRYNPSLKLAFQLATLFDVDINEVFQYTEGNLLDDYLKDLLKDTEEEN